MLSQVLQGVHLLERGRLRREECQNDFLPRSVAKKGCSPVGENPLRGSSAVRELWSKRPAVDEKVLTSGATHRWEWRPSCGELDRMNAPGCAVPASQGTALSWSRSVLSVVTPKPEQAKPLSEAALYGRDRSSQE
jgi:hypothetical protein